MTLVVFDIGATLVDGPDRGPWSRLADDLALDLVQKKLLRETLMSSDLDSPQRLAELLDERAGVCSLDAVTRLWHAQTGEAQPLKGARQALERLLATGFELALVSNIWRPYLQSVCNHFGDLFDAHIPSERRLFSFKEGTSKPDSELFARLLERARTAAHEVVMVGDSYAEDIAPAASLGIATIWLLHRPERERKAIERLARGTTVAPTTTLDSIAQLGPETIAQALADSTARSVLA